MLRRLPRLLRLGSGTTPASEGCCRRAMQTEAKGAHSVLDEVAQARLKRIKSQLEATGELPVEAPRSVAWQAVRYVWNALLLGTAGTGAAATYYTYAYSSPELTEVVKRTREESKDQPLSQLWCNAMERYLNIRKNLEARVKEYTDPATDKLLPDLHPQLRGNLITLVLDLDELLVMKEWTRQKGWSIYKRPGVQDFLLELGQYFEIVVYTDEPATYADPILTKLDPHRVVPFRLYRTDTQYKDGKHVRDLSKLNRDLTHVLMISAKPEVGVDTRWLQPAGCFERVVCSLAGVGYRKVGGNGDSLNGFLLSRTMDRFLLYAAWPKRAAEAYSWLDTLLHLVRCALVRASALLALWAVYGGVSSSAQSSDC